MTQLEWRACLEQDAQWLVGCAPRWVRRPPTASEWRRSIAQGLPAAAVVGWEGSPAALLHLSSIDGRHRRANVELWALPGVRASDLVLRALQGWLAGVWRSWPLHRVTLEWCDVEPLPPSIDTLAIAEGELQAHRWGDGRWCTVTLFAIGPGPFSSPGIESFRRSTHPTNHVRREPSGRTRGVLPLTTRTSRTRLRAATAADAPFLHVLATDPRVAFRSHTGGLLPDEAAFSEWRRSSLDVDVIVENEAGDPIGHIVLYDWQQVDGVASLGVTFPEDRWGSLAVIDALRQFLRYAFEVLGVRKVCAQIPEWNLDRLGTGIGRVLSVEAVQRDALWLYGRPWSLLHCALWPAEFARRDGDR